MRRTGALGGLEIRNVSGHDSVEELAWPRMRRCAARCGSPLAESGAEQPLLFRDVVRQAVPQTE